MEVHMILQNNNPTDISFSFLLNSNSQSLLYISLLYALNVAGNLLKPILDMNNCNGYGDYATTVRSKLIFQQYNRADIAYPNPPS